MRNYLALLGWGTTDDTTLLSTEELVRRFRVEDVGTSAAVFDEQKLRWVNGRYMRDMALDAYTERVAGFLGREPDERLRAGCEIAQEKAQTLAEVWPLIRFLFEPPVEDEKAWRKVMVEGTAEMLEAAGEALADRRAVRTAADRGRAGASARALRHQAGQALSADPGRDHRHDRLAGDIRVAGRPGARGKHFENSGCRPPSVVERRPRR